MNTNTIKFIINLKNSSNSKNEFISLKYNSQHLNILEALYREGFIQSYQTNNNLITVYFRYYQENSLLKNLKSLSKPSNLKYLNFKDINKLPSKKATFFLSTAKGILTDYECKKSRIGGKLFFIC